MKWKRETKSLAWANYYSEDGNWKAWDDYRVVKGTRRKYNPDTRRFEIADVDYHFWKLQDLRTGTILDEEFKTLKAAKEYAEKGDQR